MKICIICMNFVTGRGYQENHWADLSIELGHEVMIITTDLKSPDLRNEIKDEQRYGVNLIRIKSILLPGSIILHTQKRIYSSLEKFEPDVILWISYATYFGLAAYKYKKLHKDKVKLVGFNGEFSDLHKYIGVHNNLSIKDYAKSFGWRVLRGPLIRKVTEEADMIICTKHETRTILYTLFSNKEIAKYNNKFKHIELCFNGNNFYYDNNIRKSTRSKIGVAANEILILASSRMRKHKINTVLKQMVKDISNIVNNNKLYKFAFIGFVDDNDVSMKFKAEIESAFTPGKLTTYPIATQKELNEFYNAADIVVFNHHSNSAMQAMGTGAYVLLTNSGSFNHLLDDTITGMFFNTRIRDDLGAKIVESSKYIKQISREERAQRNSWLECRSLYGNLFEVIKKSM